MAENAQQLTPFLRAGNTLIVEIHQSRVTRKRVVSTLRSWRENSNLTIDRPVEDEHLLPLSFGAACVVRFVYEGTAYAFESSILDWDTGKTPPGCRIAWPDSVQTKTFRKHERVKLSGSCTVEWDDGHSTTAAFCDISLGGCGLSMAERATPGEDIKLEFMLPTSDAVNRVRATIRNARPRKRGGFLVGCQFSPAQEQVLTGVGLLVSDYLHRDHPGGEAMDIVIIDKNTAHARPMWEMFRTLGCEAVVIGSVDEGIAHIQAKPPVAVLVNQKMTDDGADVNRVVHAREGGVPVFLYGAAPGSGTAGAGEDAEVKGFFASDSLSEADCRKVLAALGKPVKASEP